MSIGAEHFSERSPLYRLHAEARLGRIGDSCIATAHGDQDERASAARCALLDLSNLPRVGFRGVASAACLQAQGFVLPGAPNQALAQADGSAVLRLSQNEYLLLGSLLDAQHTALTPLTASRQPPKTG